MSIIINTEAGFKKEFCGLQPVTGRCNAYIPKFFYDVNTNKCKKFTFGGCDGNNNNFETEKECEEACAEKP
ncbi:hypothetical protein TNCT_89871 [Trichonephila clavata]|uniref:BPTI/Kunitz inhibitor domain-containing protein n=1 Tax=Trichonephila clavata TaxID=2740835 RepID=A0A8X6LDC7_TRICU|nr:hypothetical protein TNCT_89871 [Trichonephila clavata]